ncbi:hypothetical protein [Kosakonia sp. MUSA4]|uniref:hypothetical protein n=1 Tax=Kosakonia sp. MUSA4 TaxID=2067958 RepID=UPI00159AA35B|nr:hypothetical protein [Kosakonia sp. MUSA4]QJT80413.1 hypothetical protein C0557_10150 [Kosakonia sp. MUSA4]
MTEAWAAIAAGVIAAAAGGIGLVMTKENKTSEFRQAWIQELRIALTTFSSILLTVRNISAEGDLVPESDNQRISQLHSEINLRINYGGKSPEEKRLSQVMTKMLSDAYAGSGLFTSTQAEFTEASFRVLKKEWKRVKRGELIYRLCMYPCLGITTIAIVLSGIYLFNHVQKLWDFLIG